MINSAVIKQLQSNPDLIIKFYAKYHDEYVSELPKYFRDNLSEEGKKIIFTSVIASRAAPYGKAGHISTIIGMLNSQYLNCSKYPPLMYLFYKKLAKPPILNVYFVGWNAGAVGNHQQVFVPNAGIPLLLDPTVGIVAEATFNQVASGKAIKKNHILDFYTRNDLQSYHKKVTQALSDGLYQPDDLLFFYRHYKTMMQSAIDDPIATPQHEVLMETLRRKKV